MKAVTWHGKRDVRVDNVPDPTIQEPTDAIVRITTTALCGSALHLYEVRGMFIEQGDILGHEPMGIVEEVGPEVTNLAPGDRVVMPFQISCGHCWMCGQGLQTQCETTQVRDQNMGAALFGYGPPDERFIYLSDVLPTSWQAVEYAGIPEGGSVTVLGLGPIGDMSSRIALHRGHRVIAVDLVPERLERTRRQGAEVLDLNEHEDLAETIREMTDGRGTDSVIDAVGMEAHGSPGAGLAQQLTGLLPDRLAQGAMQETGVDRLNAFLLAIDAVRRGGTISLSGVYGGQADPLPMLTLFDKQIQLRMGQANVKRWTEDIMPLLTGDGDPLGVEDFHTHQLPLEEAPRGYEIFQKKDDGAIKVLFKP